MERAGAPKHGPDGDVARRRVMLLALVGFALAVAGCSTTETTSYKRDKDPNAGGNGSMLREAGTARGW